MVAREELAAITVGVKARGSRLRPHGVVLSRRQHEPAAANAVQGREEAVQAREIPGVYTGSFRHRRWSGQHLRPGPKPLGPQDIITG
jgi:hypothetical protein